LENHVTVPLAPLFVASLCFASKLSWETKPQLTSSVHQCNNHHFVHPSAPSIETWPLCSSPPRWATYCSTFRINFSFSGPPFLAIQLVENSFPSLRTYILPRTVGVASTWTCISTLSSVGERLLHSRKLMRRRRRRKAECDW
jgi:hypothetical protein